MPGVSTRRRLRLLRRMIEEDPARRPVLADMLLRYRDQLRIGMDKAANGDKLEWQSGPVVLLLTSLHALSADLRGLEIWVPGEVPAHILDSPIQEVD